MRKASTSTREPSEHSPGARLRLADLLAGLSVACDLGFGLPPEEAMRSCLVATALGRKMGLGEVLAPHKQSDEDVHRSLDAFADHDTTDRLPQIAAPTLVLAGGRAATARPSLGRAVAELIPGARFEVMEEEAHQPFQEVPDEWNARVDSFWREVEARRA